MERINCFFCKKEFSSTSTRNRHLKNKHRVEVENNRNKHIICPLCSKENAEVLNNYESLNKHLNEVHCVNIKQTNISFSNIEEFEIWRKQEQRDVNYACERRIKRNNGIEEMYYKCNRSDSRGFKSNCCKRSAKTGGSIKISGVCPSRIVAKVVENGAVTITFVETHIGHIDELRAYEHIVRPHANNYQDKMTIKTHKKADQTDSLVEVGFGIFKVKSSTGSNFYTISYNKMCDNECRE
ncbi:hypothetical protein ILUMI_09606 [Ignelater luminosus]|uniref:C2H2-type domain-containing protein n=1 Tax=Ignelater luminosus TaxID=2038154 RepID=A0A8K0D3V2_IGNLU|nr:hypothetical protein ILUMI_09606 [Ignelater luminosus]